MSEKKTCPEHVAIILDGNGRWARQRGHERTYGHGFGAANVKKIISAAGEMGIKIVTLYAFSTENWKRPKIEVQFLMKLFSCLSHSFRSPIVGFYQQWTLVILHDFDSD